jgi:hypothetical protein
MSPPAVPSGSSPLTKDQALVVACGAALLAHLCHLSRFTYQPLHPHTNDLSEICRQMGHSNSTLLLDLEYCCDLANALNRIHRPDDVAALLWSDFHGTCSRLGIATGSKFDLEAKLVTAGIGQQVNGRFEVSLHIRRCLR